MAKTKAELIAETIATVDTLAMNGPYGTPAVTHCGIRAIGDLVDGRGADSDTMMGEGSIGKVRFAALGYMLDEAGLLDMNERVNDYFSRPEVMQFLKIKYGQDISGEIKALFARDDNRDSTLADLTTHYSGVGDNTMTTFVSFHREGIEGEWPLTKQIANVNKEDGTVRAMNHVVAERGKHQYSNLGYMILGDVIEAAVNKGVAHKEDLKTYKDVVKDKMLSSLGLTATKFPEDFEASDKVASSFYHDPSGKVVDTKAFKGAGSAGGMFASSGDIQEYFQELFKGFPGTPEAGVEGANRFFSTRTIQKMVDEWQKHEPAGVTLSGNKRYQAPGFTAEIDPGGNVVSYDKKGETFGFASHMVYHPATGEVDIKMTAFENVSDLAMAARIVRNAGPKDYSIDHDLMKENIEEVKAYLTKNYSIDERRQSGALLVQVVSEEIKACGGAIPKEKVPLLSHQAMAEFRTAAGSLRGCGVVSAGPADVASPIVNKKAERGRGGIA